MQSKVEKIISLSESIQTSNETDSLFEQMILIENDIKKHRNYFSNREFYHKYINFLYQFAKIRHQYGYIPPKQTNEENKKIDIISNTKNTTKTKHINNTFSSKGMLITDQLSEIKAGIQKIGKTQEDIDYLLNKLQEIKEDIENNLSVFTNVDNIQVRLQQIEQYEKNLDQSLNNLNLHNKTIETKQIKNEEGTATKRGREIQKELANLRDEVKRKDLNPIEKENLRNALLKLQNEMTTEIDKFSKYDSIPIRLNQIENYLDKLKNKEKPVKKTLISQQTEKKEITEEKNKKQKKQVIWKFGL